MTMQDSLQASTVAVERDGNDWIINVAPPRPSKKLNIEFLGDDGPYMVTVEMPLLASKGFNWSFTERAEKHQSPVKEAGPGGVRRCEVLASLQPQDLYTLRVTPLSKRHNVSPGLTHLYLSFTDDSGHHAPLGFRALNA